MVRVTIVVLWFSFRHLVNVDWQPFACIMEPNGWEYETNLYKAEVGWFMNLFSMVIYITRKTGSECLH